MLYCCHSSSAQVNKHVMHHLLTSRCCQFIFYSSRADALEDAISLPQILVGWKKSVIA